MVNNSAKTEDSSINARGEACVDNRGGLSMPGLLARVRVVEDQNTLAKGERALMKAQLSELSEQILILRLCSKGYRWMRNRLIDAFKLGDTSDGSDREKFSEEGYTMAPLKGDVIVDASLYTSKERSDVDTFERLYGLDPLQVSELKYELAITVLNVHADIISSRRGVDSKKFHESFAEFIKLLKATGYDESYLDDWEPGSLACACRSFLQCVEEEVNSKVD